MVIKMNGDKKNSDFEEELFNEENYQSKRNKEFHLNVEHKIKGIPDYHPEARIKTKTSMSVFAKIMFAIVIVGVSVILSLVIIFAAQDAFGIKKEDRPIVIDVPENAGVAAIAEILEEKEVIHSAFFFKVYYKVSKIEGNLNFGSYELNSNMSYGAIIDELQKYSKNKEEVSIMFPEGATIYEMAKLLQQNEVCKASEFINVLNTTDFGFAFEEKIPNHSKRYHSLEGYVFPNTYRFFKNDNPVSVAKKMLVEFDDILTEEDLETEIQKTGYTLDEFMTIASIVQSEAKTKEEMRKVASVYFNRLKNKETFSQLQADPTRDYANEIKSQMDIIDQSILDAYNTYEGLGLPPGPICNPGLEAIEATLTPEETPYYYFCTDTKTGEFYYAETLEEHNKNVRKAGLRQ